MMTQVTKDGQAEELWFTPDLTSWKPANLRTKTDKKKIFLSWDQPLVNGVLHPDIRGYRIYHSLDDSTYDPIGTISKNFPRTFTFFPDMDVGKHYFKVSTVFKHEYESPLSDAVSVVHGEGYGE